MHSECTCTRTDADSKFMFYWLSYFPAPLTDRSNRLSHLPKVLLPVPSSQGLVCLYWNHYAEILKIVGESSKIFQQAWEFKKIMQFWLLILYINILSSNFCREAKRSMEIKQWVQVYSGALSLSAISWQWECSFSFTLSCIDQLPAAITKGAQPGKRC